MTFLFRNSLLPLLFASVLPTLTATAAVAQGMPTPTVTAATPLQKKITQWDEYTGRFEATEQVEVRARVSGFIDKVHFTDGGMVKKGDLLFTIDPRPYELAAASARADVDKAKAQVSLAEADVDRAASLERTRILSQRDVEQRRSALSVARAAQASAEAALKSAELNLEWTQLRSPISGRISDKKVDVGNLIAGGQSGATLLTTIVNIDPIHFVFDASEADFLRYARFASKGTSSSARDIVGTAVQVRLADETEWKREGKINFVDNQLNARSGTIRGRAVFDNKDQLLTPGVFGRLRLFAGETDALLIPDAAIAADQARKVVMVVGDDNKVAPRIVALGPLAFGLRVVTSGLSPTDKVIIAGIANPFVRPGVPVNVQPGEIKPVGLASAQ